MKFIALIGAVVAQDAAKSDLHFFDFNNARMLWKEDWEGYRNARDDGDGNNCRLAESDNYYGAQQCRFSCECRGARNCERGGWCSGYDGCDGTPLPMQAPGLLPDN